MKWSSSRVIRIITGRPVFLASSAGIAVCMCVSGFFPPKPPPTYSPSSTTFLRSAFDQFPIDWLTCAVDCADACMNNFPFCQ